jgi:cytoskeletal protein RodZ
MERMGFVKKILSMVFSAVVVIGVGVGLVGCGSPTSNPTTTTTKASGSDVKEKVYKGKFVSLKDDKLTIKYEDKDKEFSVKDVKDVPKEADMKDATIEVTTKDDKVTKVEKK